MPSFSDIKQMLMGQAFGQTWLPSVNCAGKTMIVTDANTGLGLECAKHLAQLKVLHLILACRNTEKGEAAMATIYRETGCKEHTIEVWKLDLANHDSVLAFGSRVRSSQLPRLDAFIANAGVEMLEFELAESSGLEMQLTVNVVSTLLCAIAVLPKLSETSKAFDVQTHLTFSGSLYHIFGPDEELDVPEEVDMFDSLSNPESTDIMGRYALTKLMVHQCFHEFVSALSLSQSSKNGEQQHDDHYSRVVVNITSPGWCATELSCSKGSRPLGERIAFALIGWTAEKGSRAHVHAVAAGEESHVCYLAGCQFKEESTYVRSERGRRIQRKMWKDLWKRIEGISSEVAGFI